MPHRTLVAWAAIKVNALLLWLAPAVFVWLAGHHLAPALSFGQAPSPGMPNLSPVTPTSGAAGVLMGLAAILMWLGNFWIAKTQKDREFRVAERNAAWERQDKLAAQARIDADLAGQVKRAQEEARVAAAKADDQAKQLEAAHGRLSELEAKYREVQVNKAAIAANQGTSDALVTRLAEEHVVPVYPRPGAPEGTPPPTMLVVEDSPDMCRILAAMFGMQGFKVSQASTAKDAIELVDKGPHWVLLDLTLVDGSGLQVLEYIRAHRPAMKVAVMTAGAAPGVMDRITALRPDHMFLKDGDYAKLVAAVVGEKGG